MKQTKIFTSILIAASCALLVGCAGQIGGASVGGGFSLAKNGQIIQVTGNLSSNQFGAGIALTTGAGTTNATTISSSLSGKP